MERVAGKEVVAVMGTPDTDDTDEADEADNADEAVLVDLVDRTLLPFILSKKQKVNASPVWSFIRKVNTPAKNRNGKTCKYACILCIANDCQWQDCLINLHGDNSSNGQAHLNTHHAENEQWILARNSLSPQKRPFNALEHSLSVVRASKLDKVHANVMKFIVNAGLPMSLHDHPDLMTLLQSATQLNPKLYLALSRRKSEQLVIKSFHCFVKAVTADLDRVRKLFLDGVLLQNEGEHSAKFISVHHDGWDGDTKSLLGVSITYSDPLKFQVRRVALGLVHSDSHGAEDVAATVNYVLLRYGITSSDVFAAINDTANAAVAAGRLIAVDTNNTPTCQMHTMSLVYSHAIGKVTRSMNKVVVDSFVEGERLRLAIHKMFSFIWNKRAKKRAGTYKTRNQVVGHKTVRCPIDNATRINGTHRMYEFALRSKFCLDVYFNGEQVPVRTAYAISEIDWWIIAELEAVMRSTAEYSIKVQTERNTSMSMSYIWSLKARFDTIDSPNFDVVDLDRGMLMENPVTLAQGWDSKTQFKDLPMKTMTTCPEQSAAKRYPMMSPLAILLQDRLRQEFEKYFPPPDDALLIAMACNPIMITVGKSILLNKPKEAYLWAKALGLLRNAVKEEASTRVPVEQVVDIVREDSIHPGDDEVDSDCEFLGERDQAFAVPTFSQSMHWSERAEQELLQWQSIQINFVEVAKEQGASLPPRKTTNALFLSDVIDVNRWWSNMLVAKPQDFSLMSRVAARYLNKPPANGLQERVFGTAKFIDTPLRRSLGNDRFEMLSLLKFNACLIGQLEQDLTSATEQVVISAVANFFDLDLDPESEDDCSGGDKEEDEIVCLTSVLRDMSTSKVNDLNPKPAKQKRH
jgi:hypothetical protein